MSTPPPNSRSATPATPFPAFTEIMGSSEVEYQSVWTKLAILHATKNREKAIALVNGDLDMQAGIELQLADAFDRVCNGVHAALKLTPYYSVMGKEIKTIWYEKTVWKIIFPDDEFIGDTTKLDDFEDWFHGVSFGERLAIMELTIEGFTEKGGEEKSAEGDDGDKTIEKGDGEKSVEKGNGGESAEKGDGENPTEVIEVSEADEDEDATTEIIEHSEEECEASEVGVDVDGWTIIDGEAADRYADGETDSTDGGAKLKYI